ncbi:MAG: rod shape-determining protein MreC [Bryobacteraceae bacterium]|jgi:rod shape-determining protein MreC
MDGLFSRYRNLSALLALLAGQLLLLAWQIKSDGETRLIRVWAVTAVTPIVRGLEAVREGAGGLAQRWFLAGALESENARLKRQAAELQIRNQLLAEQLQQAGRAQALLAFRSQLGSHSLPATIVGSAPGVQSGVFFIDRGSPDGVKRGMAVVTGDGIAGQVVAVYPSASLIMLANSQGFAASVISQKHRTRGLLKGDGSSCHVEGIRNEQALDESEWFYTSGDDRIFPRGLRVGPVRSVRNSSDGKEVEVRPAALDGDVSEVLILLDAVHGQIPDLATPAQPDVQVLPQPPEDSRESAAAAAAAASPAPAGGSSPTPRTDADRLRERYKRIVEGQGIQVGVTPFRAPDFNRQPAAQAAPSGAGATPVIQPPGGPAQPGVPATATAPDGKAAPTPPKRAPAVPPSLQEQR